MAECRMPSDAEIEAALEEARNAPPEVTILDAVYRPEPGLEFLMLRLSDGRRLLLPREEIKALRNATREQAMDFAVGPHGVDVWWPQLDDGIHLPNLLEARDGAKPGVAA